MVLAVLVAATGCDGVSPSTVGSAPAGAAGASTAGAGGGAGSSGDSGSANGGSSGVSSGSGGAAGSAGVGGLSPDDSSSWTWEPCGTIPSTEVPEYMEYEVGSPIVGGHPRVTGALGSRWNMTGLAMSADGLSLVSMGGVTLVWNVASDFSASSAIYVDRASPEWPKVDISPDGRWIAISGDGRRIVSRSGLQAVGFESNSGILEPCFPIELRFSPDGQWLAGAGWGGGIGVFRVADLEASAAPGLGTLDPTASIPASCVVNPELANLRTATRSAFTPDGRTLVTETGGRYATADWQELEGPHMDPALHSLRGGFEVSALGSTLVSDCPSDLACRSYPAPFPKFSPDGHWIVAGATLTHVSGVGRDLDASALVGIFAPNGDVIAAGADNSLTRYCKIE